MAYKMTFEDYSPYVKGFVREYICDTEADAANLPSCGTGSSALVVEGGKVYMVNASGKWEAFGG